MKDYLREAQDALDFGDHAMGEVKQIAYLRAIGHALVALVETQERQVDQARRLAELGEGN